MTKSLYKKCNRCSGTGAYLGDRTCFGCNGAGQIVADEFSRVVGTAGLFFGVTSEVGKYGANAGKVSKGIRREASAEKLEQNLTAGATYKEITEEQARAFYKRFGVGTKVAA